MTQPSYLKWPFFADRHRELAARFAAWAAGALAHARTAPVVVASPRARSVLETVGNRSRWRQTAGPAPPS